MSPNNTPNTHGAQGVQGKKRTNWVRHLALTTGMTVLGLVLILAFFNEFNAITTSIYQWLTEMWVFLSGIRLALIVLIAIHWTTIVQWLARWARLTSANTDYLLSRRWVYIFALLLLEGLGIHYSLTRLS